MAAAVLPTAPVKEVARLVFDRAQRFRSSIAFWAHPLCGKSSCIYALEKLAPAQFPGSAFVVYEPSSKEVAAEGALIEDLLSIIDYEPRVHRSLAGKRDQLLRALYAMSVSGRHLFLVIDEAQNLHVKDLGWLKRVVNWLNVHEIKVTVVLFGQSQLCTMHQRFMAEMPDLTIRFMAELIEFRSLQISASFSSRATRRPNTPAGLGGHTRNICGRVPMPMASAWRTVHQSCTKRFGLNQLEWSTMKA